MSTLEQALEVLEFKSLEDVTAESLKISFKKTVMTAHPDKGGDYDRFETLLSAYLFLSKVLKRLSGGRDQLQSSIFVEDVKEAREQQFVNELNNLMNEVFDQLDHSSHYTFNTQFNEQFEKYRQQEKENGVYNLEQEKGYESWLRNREDEKLSHNIDYVWSKGIAGQDPLLEQIHTPPVFAEKDLNKMFEYSAKCGKAEPTTLILHPDEMAFVSGRSLGTSLIQKACNSFTSDPDSSPEYTDLKSAYTSDNTLFDKLPTYEEKRRTFEELLKEREIEYKTELDRDLEAIAAYENKKLEDEKEHKKRIGEYFKNAPSNQWALRSSSVPNDVESDSKDYFLL